MNVVVVGGTGGFGMTICRMLLDEGHSVTAIGRSRSRGEAARSALPGLVFRSMDRSEIGPEAIYRLKADVVVDASGPFQDMETNLAEAALEAGVHYIDIADDRMFVARVRELDEQAVERGVILLSGASSVPALSSAVALDLAGRMDEVDRVDVSITASSQAAFGTSVLASMLAGAGRSIAHVGSEPGTGMMEYRHVEFNAGRHRLRRLVLSCDVPDHDELAPLLPGKPDVRFRAGSELDIHNWTMWSIAAVVRMGVLSDARRLLSAAKRGRGMFNRSGDGRSGMKVEVRGRRSGDPIMAQWTLVAIDGHGPMIPCLVVPAIVNMIAEGRLPYGARSAAGSVAIDDVLRRMPEGSIVTATGDSTPTPLYRRVMGDAFYKLSPAVRRMHDDPWISRACGRAKVTGSRNPIARMICRLMGFPPPSSDLPVRVTFERLGDEEKWTRQFGRYRFQSRLHREGRRLVESFGPLAFHFSIQVEDGSLAMIPQGWTAFGLRMPKAMGPGGIAREHGEGGLFTFDVPIRLPLLGEVLRYEGWLQAEIVRR